MDFRALLLLLVIVSSLSGDPWGRDAELVFPSPPAEDPVGGFGAGMIRYYQKNISPISGPRSSFLPTSSEYTRQAIVKFGYAKGIAIGCDRLLRENGEEWVYPLIFKYGSWRKYDPIP
jgi:hypothetical protein